MNYHIAVNDLVVALCFVVLVSSVIIFLLAVV